MSWELASYTEVKLLAEFLMLPLMMVPASQLYLSIHVYRKVACYSARRRQDQALTLTITDDRVLKGH